MVSNRWSMNTQSPTYVRVVGTSLMGLALVAVWLAAVACGGGDLKTSTQPAPQATQPLPAASAPAPSAVEVPLNVKSASRLGSLQLELVFDPSVAELTGVKAGPLARNALVDSRAVSKGRVRIGLADPSGISGDGAVITLSFKPAEGGNTGALAVEQVEASDVDLRDLVVTSAPGRFPTTGGLVQGPLLSFGR